MNQSGGVSKGSGAHYENHAVRRKITAFLHGDLSDEIFMK
jgi:hypothetical protein